MTARVWRVVVVALLCCAARPSGADDVPAGGSNGNGNGHAAPAAGYEPSSNGHPADGNGQAAYTGYPVLEIWKRDRRMELRAGSTVVRQFRVVLGREPRDSKRHRGDARTPVGRYYVSNKNPNSRFRRCLGLSYPNVDDAERGYKVGLIDAGQWADIFFANLRGDTPPSHTPLGGWVGIHGFGGRPYIPVDWTLGCVAVSDEEIDYIYDVVPIGSAVIINE